MHKRFARTSIETPPQTVPKVDPSSLSSRKAISSRIFSNRILLDGSDGNNFSPVSGNRLSICLIISMLSGMGLPLSISVGTNVLGFND